MSLAEEVDLLRGIALFERMEPAAQNQVERFFDNCANPHQD